MRTISIAICAIFGFAISSNIAYAQQDETTHVQNAVNRLFDAMRNSDSAGVVNAFLPGGILQTIAKSPNGEVTVRNQSISAFGGSVAKSKPGDLDEQIEFGAIHIDGDLASVWTPYKFMYQQKLSHGGVNSFQLVKVNGEWKIQYIIDTRKK